MPNVSSSEKLQLNSLKNNEVFNRCIKKLVLNTKLEDNEISYILSSAIIFFRYYNNDKRYKSFFNIGYYLILKYGLIHNDYKPLYDISLQIGFYPISDYILSNDYLSETTLNEVLINKEINRRYKNADYIETIEQYNRSKEIFNNIDKNTLAYIAPTSYGKSSIIRDVIKQNNFQKIAIIVPTKSLLIQTYRDIRKLRLPYKLILHDEMYNNESRFIGILTQERATRLVSKYNIGFDFLFIDEAHNLLDIDSRNILLGRFIMQNHRINQEQRILYLSPLVSNPSNLKLKNISENEVYASVIKHNMKIFDTYFLNKKGKLSKYNHFTNDFYKLDIDTNYVFSTYITNNSKDKNFVYNYRPKYIESIALDLFNNFIDNKVNNEDLNFIANVISKEIHEDLNLVDYVKKGVIYLHGKLPNILKEYLENAFKEIKEIKYIVANSVILEGINFPIDNLFITSTYGLTGKDLNNLIGRVNRLNYVFNNSLNRLLSDIHFVDSDPYTDRRSNMINKIELLRQHTFDDINRNPLLENYDIEKLKISAEEKKKKKEKDNKIIGLTALLLKDDIDTSIDKLIHYLVENNIDDFYSNVNEAARTIIENIKNIADKDDIALSIYDIFIRNLEGSIKDFELERLKNEKARNYYNNYINIFQLLSLKDKIASTITYFDTKSKNSLDPYLYIGGSFGEISKSSSRYENRESLNNVYIDLRNKTKKQFANIALVKIKMEEDFVSFKLKKLITFLYDFDLIDEEMYLKAIYGSTDLNIINLTRIGLSPNIIAILKQQNQITNITFDDYGNLVSNQIFQLFLESQSELFKFEINKYIS